MWPLGYILGSPYSPLNLEQQLESPDLNWRDRFEDLLALESGKKMISAVSRQNEAATASRIYNESVQDEISHVNQELRRNQESVVILQNLREMSVRRKDTLLVSSIDDEALPNQKKSAETAVASGNALIGSLKQLQNEAASTYKRRVPWITSLISSGAMLGWESVVYDSSDGSQSDVYKTDGSGDGHLFTELDLAMIFKKGYRLDFRDPEWSTYEGSYSTVNYPQVERLSRKGDADPAAKHIHSTINNLRPSILSQLTTVQKRKLWNGSIETRVVLKNRFTDGKEEEKTIVNDASKVLEEVEKANASIRERHRAFHLALWDSSYRQLEQRLAGAKEVEDEVVE